MPNKIVKMTDGKASDALSSYRIDLIWILKA